MRLQALISAVALSKSALAFSDATPWVMYSTAPFDGPSSNQLQTSSNVLRSAERILSECPTDRYVVATQPGMIAADLQRRHGWDMPSLYRAAVLDPRIKAKYIVSEVIGDFTDAKLADLIKSSCSKKGKDVIVQEVSLPQLPREGRATALKENDGVLSNTIGDTKDWDSFTVLFYSPSGEPTYEPEFQEPLRMEIKRDTLGTQHRRASGTPDRDTRPLFEKYQFFTPGIFMALITAFVLFSILGVGIRALSSLEVPYGAFEKEMGPAAQRKQQ